MVKALRRAALLCSIAFAATVPQGASAEGSAVLLGAIARARDPSFRAAEVVPVLARLTLHPDEEVQNSAREALRGLEPRTLADYHAITAALDFVASSTKMLVNLVIFEKERRTLESLGLGSDLQFAVDPGIAPRVVRTLTEMRDDLAPRVPRELRLRSDEIARRQQAWFGTRMRTNPFDLPVYFRVNDLWFTPIREIFPEAAAAHDAPSWDILTLQTQSKAFLRASHVAFRLGALPVDLPSAGLEPSKDSEEMRRRMRADLHAVGVRLGELILRSSHEPRRETATPAVMGTDLATYRTPAEGGAIAPLRPTAQDDIIRALLKADEIFEAAKSHIYDGSREHSRKSQRVGIYGLAAFAAGGVVAITGSLLDIDAVTIAGGSTIAVGMLGFMGGGIYRDLFSEDKDAAASKARALAHYEEALTAFWDGVSAPGIAVPAAAEGRTLWLRRMLLGQPVDVAAAAEDEATAAAPTDGAESATPGVNTCPENLTSAADLHGAAPATVPAAAQAPKPSLLQRLRLRR